MKYQKLNYSIIGHFDGWKKFKIVTRKSVTGYTTEEYPEIAIRKAGKSWYVDHLATGLAVVSVGSPTRDAAINNYAENFKAKVDAFDQKDGFRNAAETFQNAPLESDVYAWESVHFCTVYDHRFDAVTSAAKRAGLIVQKAGEGTYLNGGEVDIIGTHEALEGIREMIAKSDAERAEIISEPALASDPEQKPEPKQEEQPKQPEQPEQAAATPEAERTAKPEKFFIGTTISGNGWKIYFDGDAQRTRIIFSRDPSADERAEVEDAGFYYSKKMGSWNKKLTFKAYRAALKVAERLQKIARTAAA
jgi:hypothetical protein